MAEASAAGAGAGAAVAAHRFFCHFCKGEVSPKLPEYICPRCESGFIEEVTDDSSFVGGGSSRIDNSTSTHFAECEDVKLISWYLLHIQSVWKCQVKLLSFSAVVQKRTLDNSVLTQFTPITLLSSKDYKLNGN
uniref:E3 ubiquitin-protein ligase RNF115-like n=1 Tax=Panthera onca TaxID=9690 RepID=UPI00295413BE|nr:E3 ubiquitin-protein ligase RNF115-like [Panthera onca]